MILLENELDSLKRKHDENMLSAYANIIKSEEKSYKNELEVILDYYGIDSGVEADTFEKQLDEIKNKFDINYRIITLEKGWNRNSALPLLVSKDGVFKAVVPGFSGKCKYYKNNKKTVMTDKEAENFSDTALCFYKGFNSEKVSRAAFIKYMLGCVSLCEYAAVILSAALVMLFSTVISQVQYYIFNNLIPAETSGGILPMTCLLLGVIIISAVIYIFKETAAANIPICISTSLQGAVISRLLKLRASFFSDNKAGKLSSGIMNISDISNIISSDTISSLLSFLLSVIYAVYMYIYSKEFMSYVYLSFIFVFILTIINTKLMKRYNNRFIDKTNDMTGFVYEMFTGMENIKLNNAGAKMFNRWSGYYSESLKSQKKPFLVKYYNALYYLIISLFTLVIYKAGIENQTQTADFIAFMSLYGLFMGSVVGISNVFKAYADFNSSYNQLSDFFTADIEKTDLKKEIESFSGNIEFSNISFKYPDSGAYILENISFTVKKGQKIGITGKSGCGKSTLIRLLLGFEQPEKGRIFIDNADLNEINLSSYRKKLGVVLQSTKLIPMDIFSNITLTSPDSSYEEVLETVRMVGLKEDIEKMPMGLYTFVSDDNLTISLGQKQRILLARAILSKPSLLVLDEATNALDNITQAAVTRYIDSMDTTAIIVAHRLSTIKECDSIFVLDGGVVAEQGKFDELIAKKGVFYNLFKNQMYSKQE